MLLVFDEIATGFGRTGALFAAEHAGVAPDVMCVGKALTGGYLSMAAALCTPRIARGISDGEAGVLMHGPTFMGNPLAAAVSIASIRLLQERGLARRGPGDRVRAAHGARARARAARGGRRARARRHRCRPARPSRRRRGGHAGAAADQGVWLRPFRDLVYTMPPYVCSPDDLAMIAEGVRAAAVAG